MPGKRKIDYDSDPESDSESDCESESSSGFLSPNRIILLVSESESGSGSESDSDSDQDSKSDVDVESEESSGESGESKDEMKSIPPSQKDIVVKVFRFKSPIHDPVYIGHTISTLPQRRRGLIAKARKVTSGFYRVMNEVGPHRFEMTLLEEVKFPAGTTRSVYDKKIVEYLDKYQKMEKPGTLFKINSAPGRPPLLLQKSLVGFTMSLRHTTI